jgi:hypothetical protein
MATSSTRRDRPRRDTARLHVPLDAAAQARLDALRTAVGRLPTQLRREVIRWGLRQGEGGRVDCPRVLSPAHTIVVRLEPAVRPHVHAAAQAAGVMPRPGCATSCTR